jgi:hypothetical protein
MTDLGYEGNGWALEKRVAGGSFCRVQLDRALATAPGAHASHRPQWAPNQRNVRSQSYFSTVVRDSEATPGY